MTSARWILSAFMLLPLGCQQDEQQDIPNRVLDRPTDVALVCAVVECTQTDDGAETCVTEPQPLNLCESESSSCASDNPHLIGFVANSERNEIAMFTKCSNRLVDMDVESPGYDFIPVGQLPTELDASDDGCRVVSANVGSCDLSVLDAPGLAAFGLGNNAELGDSEVDEPSTLASAVVPRTFDPVSGQIRPLGARPSHILITPDSLTQAPAPAPGTTLEGLCDPQVPRSAYVSFPTCNLVAEIDLRTGNILQSRQFVSNDMGGITVEDTGISPSCPVECPVQFEQLPTSIPAIDEASAFVQALALSLELSEAEQLDDADAAIEGQRLFVGGLGSNIVFELPIGASGQWAATDNQLELANAGGVKRIQVSPAVNASVGGSEFSQFLYVVAGDGSTRVVGRELPAATDSVGIECETQLDPSVLTEAEASACTPVGQVAIDPITQEPTDVQPSERRALSRGPGIRPGRGEEVTDWIFRKVYEGNTGAGPFAEPGTVAVGVTSGGFGIFAMINQDRANGQTTLGAAIDPADIMDVRLFAHSLWPTPIDADSPFITQPPLMLDADPGRSIPNDSGAVRQLAPTLRRIDSTYVEDERASEQLGVVDLDGLGAIYDDHVVRAAVHDYRSWGASGGPSWTLEWEGTITGTGSTTGVIECDVEGWPSGETDPTNPSVELEGATCLAGSRLRDDSANFCEDGVLRGDKLVLVGCGNDDACGEGRRCLTETSAGGQSTGICIPEQDYEQRGALLREVCGDFISDPCGEAVREFTITKATQSELWLQSMDRPMSSYLATTACEDVANAVVVDDACVCLPGFSPAACGPGGEGECCPDQQAWLGGQAPVLEVEGRYVCTEDQPDDGCTEDADCNEGVCIDARCRVPCEGDDCIYRRLPGPECFGEFVQYQVALRNAFRVSGTGYEFLSNRVEISPEDGTCQPTDDAELSHLLSSRLPLPPSDRPDDPEWLAIPTCDDDVVSPTDPNPCRIVAARAQANKFHLFEYEDRVSVSALRYSNPVFSIILDLTALEGLTNDVPGYDDSVWPLDFVGFRRSRIPRGYRMSFGLESGYAPFANFLLLEGRPVTYPVRILAGPQSEVAYIVDGSGPGASSSIRGQVIRVTLGDTFATDEGFLGVR
jgi:hypothetical protein